MSPMSHVPLSVSPGAAATMDLLFGRRKTPEELLRQNQRALARAMRELDRERQKLEAQEKKIIVDIKKMAKQGQMVRGHPRGGDVESTGRLQEGWDNTEGTTGLLWVTWRGRGGERRGDTRTQRGPRDCSGDTGT